MFSLFIKKDGLRVCNVKEEEGQMAYFAVFLRVADREVAATYHEEHVQYVKQLCKEEKIHLVGKLIDAGGLIIFQADQKETVEAWLAEDPFIIHGARTYEIFEWDMKMAAEYLA